MRSGTGERTIPTNLTSPEMIELMNDGRRCDPFRDCDGTEFPRELVETGAKIYATYYTTRKDNEWAKKNPMSESNAILCRLFIRRWIKR